MPYDRAAIPSAVLVMGGAASDAAVPEDGTDPQVRVGWVRSCFYGQQDQQQSFSQGSLFSFHCTQAPLQRVASLHLSARFAQPACYL